MAPVMKVGARKMLFDILDTSNYKVYNFGQHYKQDSNPYIVLRAMSQTQSTLNRKGIYEQFEVQCYVPDTSTLLLDNMIYVIEELLFSGKVKRIRYLGIVTEDYHDEDIKMYMRAIQVEIPRTVWGCP